MMVWQSSIWDPYAGTFASSLSRVAVSSRFSSSAALRSALNFSALRARSLQSQTQESAPRDVQRPRPSWAD